MSATDLLSQDEIDALLHGVDGGDVETETDEPLEEGAARQYDFASQDRIVPVSYTHLTLPTTCRVCRSRWSPYH